MNDLKVVLLAIGIILIQRVQLQHGIVTWGGSCNVNSNIVGGLVVKIGVCHRVIENRNPCNSYKGK